MRLALIGAGRVGTAICETLRRRGHSISGVSSRTLISAERAAGFLHTTTFDLDGPVPEVDVMLLGVSDDALPGIVAKIAPCAQPGMVFWHVSGSLGLQPLAPVIERGAEGCALHPMQAFPNVDAGIRNLPGSTWGATVTPAIDGWARRLVAEDLEGRSVTVRPEHRALWHAASITTSTGVNAVMAMGEALLEEIGVERPEEALGALIRGTLETSLSQGARRSLTGPVVRGEGTVLTRHLSALEASSDGTLREDYLRIARLVLDGAARAGSVDETVVREMNALLDRLRS